VSNRTYLSIGDVLSLLRQEFPDVTISKIRFLESQGLVNPERSPSGYRKFYSHDVERLRWVLRQQREHFLPLKVIRDRLAGTDGVPSDDTDDTDDTKDTVDTDATSELEVASANGSGVRDGAARTNEPAMAGARRVAPAAPREPQAPALARPVPAVAHSPRPEPQPVPAAVAPVVTAPAFAPPAASATAAPVPTAAAPSSPPPAAVVARATPAPAVGGRSEPDPPTERPVRPAAGDRAVPVQVEAPGEVAGQPPEAPPGTSLTIDELCNASGLSITEVAALEGFGLIEPVTVAGTLYYDEECLTVAKLVSDFARYGIEPRHLRLYRNAVDRELGLVEQIITPLLRQRNPEARKRAVDAAADLSRLGQQLRGALLRRAVRNQFGG
jgi:DNA-binding transcriptional MerR regulator